MASPGASDTLSIKYDNWIIFLFLDMDHRSFSSYYSLPPLSRVLNSLENLFHNTVGKWITVTDGLWRFHTHCNLFVQEWKKKKKKETLVLWGYYQRQQIRHCNAALHSGFNPFPKLLWLGIYYSWIWNFLSGMSKSTMKMIQCKELRQLQFIFTILSETIVCYCREMLKNGNLPLWQ